MATKNAVVAMALLALLILCCFYCRDGIEGMTTGSFTTADGAYTATAVDDTLLVTNNASGNVETYTPSSVPGSYTGVGGRTAVVTNGALVVTDSSGAVVVTKNDNPNNYNSYNNTNSYNYDHFSKESYPTTFYGPSGGTLRIEDNGGKKTIAVTTSDGTAYVYTFDSAQAGADVYVGDQGGSAMVLTSSDGSMYVEVTGPNGDTVRFTDEQGTSNNQDGVYNDSLPQGIPRSMIPAGSEDMYILKSEVVPPVCPQCPAPVIIKTGEKAECQPCPACARCPEPNFECVKQPNYSSINKSRLPQPAMSSFTAFT